MNLASFVALCLVTLFYVFMEWLFIVTKPSVLDMVQPLERLFPLLLSFLGLCLALCALQCLLVTLDSLLPLGAAARRKYRIELWLPALVLTCSGYLMLDNFTYTLMGFSTFSLKSYDRVFYLILIVGVALWSHRFLKNALDNFADLAKFVKWGGALSAVVILLACVALVLSLQRENRPDVVGLDAPIKSNDKTPNILILSTDGLSAARMSVYGYRRQTTPFIAAIADQMLKFENHFSNSTSTTASVGSLFTSKYPSTTRVVFRPDVFLQRHAYEHLPGLLKTIGYTTGDVSVRHFVDPVDLNLRNGFDYANGRYLQADSYGLLNFAVKALPVETVFADELLQRVKSRILHVSGYATVHNPFRMVTDPESYGYHGMDRQRVEEAKRFISSARQPFFLHLHLEGTHGPRFYVEHQVFSSGKSQSEDWMVDFYDDAVLQYDRYVKEVFSLLAEKKILENTIVVLNTDHGHSWSTSHPLPLLIRFPGQEHVGVRRQNSQRIDIAPTLLDYLGIEKPPWMEGRSLLSEELSPMYPIFSMTRTWAEKEGYWSRVRRMRPPFYSLGGVSVVYCNFYYQWYFDLGEISKTKIDSHTLPCDPAGQPSKADVREAIIRHLDERGYDTGSLRVEDSSLG